MVSTTGHSEYDNGPEDFDNDQYVGKDPMDLERPLYGILGVRPDATEEEIRKAYRQAASAIHPDKIHDPDLREEAARAFSDLQHAHEVLSDPAKRDVYDIYGEEGLKAGMDLVDAAGRSREDLRREWQAFKDRQRQEELDASVNYRGKYVFRVDATALVRPYSRNVSRKPEIVSIYMSSGVDLPVEFMTPENVRPFVGHKMASVLGAERDIAHLGGMVYVRRSEGQGSFIAGYKRAWSNYTTLNAQAVVGLRTLLSASTSIQLSKNASATLAATWQPNAGPGLQFITSRQLTERTQAEFSWIIGPREASGMGLAISHRSDKMLISGGFDVGSATGMQLRIVRQITESSTGKLSFKIGFSGAEIDVGGSKRINEATIAGMYVVAGTKGVLVRLRYSRGGHVFEFPITLSPSFDPSLLAAALTIPSALIYAGSEWIARPLGRILASKKSMMERKEHALEIQQALDRALSTQALLNGVSKRRTQKAALEKSLVIVFALYGEEQAVKQLATSRLEEKLNECSEERHKFKDMKASSATEGNDLQEDGPSASGDRTSDDREIERQDNGSAEEDSSLAPSMLDVTVPLQYLSDSRSLTLHKGYSKSRLMGFCDPSPGSSKVLIIYYSFQNSPRICLIADADGASLPAQGRELEGSEKEMVQQLVSKYE